MDEPAGPTRNNATQKETPHWRLLWRVILIAHATLAIAWWWVMPGGFPMWHLRFWSNFAIPWTIALLAVAGLIGFWTRRTALLQPLLVAVPVGWTATLIASVVVFPISSRRFVPPISCYTVSCLSRNWSFPGFGLT